MTARKLVLSLSLTAIFATSGSPATIPPCGSIQPAELRRAAISPDLADLDRRLGPYSPVEDIAAAEATLASGLTSAREGDRRIAARLLVRLPGDAHQSELSSYAATETSLHALLAFARAAASGPDPSRFGTQVFMELLRCNEHGVRQSALTSALGAFPRDVPQKLAPAIVGAWGGMTADERNLAIRLLSRSRAPEALPIAFEVFRDKETSRYRADAARLVARSGSRSDSLQLLEIWLTETRLRGSAASSERLTIFRAALDGVDGPARPFIAALFEMERDETTRSEMAKAALEKQAGVGTRPQPPLDRETADRLLDDFNSRFHAVYGLTHERIFPPLAAAVRALATSEERLAAWSHVLTLYPLPSGASAEASGGLAWELEIAGEIEEALPYSQFAAEIQPHRWNHQYSRLRQLVTARMSVRASKHLAAEAAPSRNGTIVVSLRNGNDFSLMLPSRAEGDLQLWIDCMSGSRVVHSHPATVIRGPVTYETLHPGRFIAFELEDPGCRLEPETILRPRIFLYPSPGNDTFVGSVASTGLIRRSTRDFSPQGYAPTELRP